MTPKEKAMHLMCKFYLMNTETGNYICKTLAKQCALLCVDELLQQISLPKDEWFEERKEYLQEVKEELEAFN